MRKQEFNSKLISLLPLDEVPVHVPLRRPRPLRFARLPVPVWNPYSRGRLSPAKSEDRKGGEGKTDVNLTIFFSTCCARGDHPREVVTRRVPCPRPSAQFQSMLFKSNKLLATEGRETLTTLRFCVTGGGSPVKFVSDCLPLWPSVRKIGNMRGRVRWMFDQAC